MYSNLGYYGVEYEKYEKIWFFKKGQGTCVDKLEWFKCYFSVIFEWFVMSMQFALDKYQVCEILIWHSDTNGICV